ncbi:MAG: ATP-binding cassette domain-containing protein [Gemmatimonadota bacterium]
MPDSRVDLVARDITTGYLKFRSEQVVTRASFKVDAGTVVALVGPNGSGKSTLLHTIAGLIPVLSGSVSIGGQPPTEYRLRHGIGYLAEGMTLPDAWSARGMLTLTALTCGGHAAAAIPAALEIAGVDFDLTHPIRQLSKGMRQRLLLALTLIPLPRLLLLDEPEAGLDPGQRVSLRQRIRTFAAEGRTVIVASHDVSSLSTIADQTYLISRGAMHLLEPSDLSRPERLMSLFAPTHGDS